MTNTWMRILIAAALAGPVARAWGQDGDVGQDERQVAGTSYDLRQDVRDLKEDAVDVAQDRAALRTAYEAYRKAVDEFGAGSAQAKTDEAKVDAAQLALHQEIGDFHQDLWDASKDRRRLAIERRDLFKDTHPGVGEIDGRIRNLLARIQDGVASGKITPEEAAELRAQVRGLAGETKGMAAMEGGRLTGVEDKALNQQASLIGDGIQDARQDGAKETAWAKAHPAMAELNEELRGIRQDLREGLQSGKLTPYEARELALRDQTIAATEKADASKNGGHLTAQEVYNLNEAVDGVAYQLREEDKYTSWQKNHPERAQINDRVRDEAFAVRLALEEGRITPEEAKGLVEQMRGVLAQEAEMASQNGSHLTAAEQETLRGELGKLSSSLASEGHFTPWEMQHPAPTEVKERAANLYRGIDQALAKGDLTDAQAAQMRAEVRDVVQQERDMAALNDGHLSSAAEFKALNQEENKIKATLGADALKVDIASDVRDLRKDASQVRADRSALRSSREAYEQAVKQYGPDSAQAKAAEAKIDRTQTALFRERLDLRRDRLDIRQDRRERRAARAERAERQERLERREERQQRLERIERRERMLHRN